MDVGSVGYTISILQRVFDLFLCFFRCTEIERKKGNFGTTLVN